MSSKNNVDNQYQELMKLVLRDGEWQESRTGTRLKCLFGHQMRFDLREGFPLLTSRRTPYKSAFVEVEGFLKGITDKSWFEDRGCKFWSWWCNPQKVPYATDEETQKLMAGERDLGVVYGSQYRNFCDPQHPENGVDQLKSVVDRIRKKEDDRRLIISAWNPLAFDHMALLPCHFTMTFHISPCKTYLDLKWDQRSVDLALGHNIHNYALILTLMAHEGGLIPRFLIPSYGNVHVYENQIEVAYEQCMRDSHELPTIHLKEWKFNDIFDWTSDCVEVMDYVHSGSLKYPRVAI